MTIVKFVYEDDDVPQLELEVEDVSSENLQSICDDEDYVMEDIVDYEDGTIEVLISKE